MSSAVMIAYYFPPEGSAGAYRPLRFVRHLQKTGWSTAIISAEPPNYERCDPNLLDLVPRQTEIVRVRHTDLWQAVQARRAQRIRQRLSALPRAAAEQVLAAQQNTIRSTIREAVRTLEAWYYQPDFARSWIQPAVEAAVNLCKRKKPDVIWATAGPLSAWVVAYQASQRTGIPYVLDLRDPYGFNYYEFETKRPGWAANAERRTLSTLFVRARAVVLMFDTIAECYVRAYTGALDATKIHIIPNGYDGPIEEFASSGGGKCTILYTGTVSNYRYDTFLQSLELLSKKDKSLVNRLRVVFVGEDVGALARHAKALGLSAIVQTSGPVSYSESARLQREAHALLILGRKPTRGSELVAGAKLFEYLRSGRPILGVLPDDEAKKTLNRLRVPTVADVNSHEEIVALVQRFLEAWSTSTLASLVPDRSACEAYSTERQTASLIRALQGAPATDPFVPGSVEIPPSLRRDIDNARTQCA